MILLMGWMAAQNCKEASSSVKAVSYHMKGTSCKAFTICREEVKNRH